MERQIPIYFDTITVSSPLERISSQNPNLGRLKVRAFTKYANRNASYITESVAEQLIQSATSGSTPVIGFFDPESQSWSSHTGPKLANAYGYVENFLGWEPFTDTDGITRDYAVFSVILFTDYFEEAKKILGENQSMELDPTSIEGDWAEIENQEYFVFTKAKILGLCVIGQHEPCFSVSAFFSKNDDLYNSQFEKFSSLLSGLKTLVEEADNELKGGEQPMNELENIEVVEETSQEPEVVEEFSNEEVVENTEETETVVEVETENEVEVVEESNEPSEYELLQQRYNELQEAFNELQTNYNTVCEERAQFQQAVNDAVNESNSLREQNATLQATVDAYASVAAEQEVARKNELLDQYSSLIDAAEIDDARANINDFSYEALESKLAVSFANKQINKKQVSRIPLAEQESAFALLMKNYRK